MAVVTVFATSPSRQDRCGLCFRVARFLLNPPPLLWHFFFLPQSLVLHILKWESLKKKYEKRSVTHMLRLAEQLLEAAVDGLSCKYLGGDQHLSKGKQSRCLTQKANCDAIDQTCKCCF